MRRGRRFAADKFRFEGPASLMGAAAGAQAPRRRAAADMPLPPDVFAAKCPIDAREAGAGWCGKSGKSGMVDAAVRGSPRKEAAVRVGRADSTPAGGGFTVLCTKVGTVSN